MPMSPERRAVALRQDAMIQGAAGPMRRDIAQEKNIFIRQCAESWRNNKMFRHDDYLHHERRVKNILYKYYMRVGMMMNKEVLNQIKAKRPDIEVKAQSKYEAFLQRWAAAEAGRKATPIAGTTLADLNRAVQNAYASPDAETTVISSILAVRGYSDFRANTIARTETHNAAMFASLETANDFADEQSVVMLKAWSPTVDDRSREYHAVMENADAIPMDETFQVENPNGGHDEMIGPGDPSAPPEQVINCRCVLTYEVQ